MLTGVAGLVFGARRAPGGRWLDDLGVTAGSLPLLALLELAEPRRGGGGGFGLSVICETLGANGLSSASTGAPVRCWTRSAYTSKIYPARHFLRLRSPPSLDPSCMR